MSERIYINKLLRLTLVRKGRGMAKHPELRDGVVEVVKATSPTEPLWETVQKAEESDWYADFEAFVESEGYDGQLDAEEAFSLLAESEPSSEGLTQKAGKKRRNYPDSEGPFAGPHNSFPIKTQKQVYSAAKLIGHASNPAQVKANIIRIARERGFKLPKSWTKVSKSMDEELMNALVERIAQRLAPTPPEGEASGLRPQTTEKAKTPPHSHLHSHVTTYGYSYSHEHAHGDAAHADADDHGTSETMHAHEHVAKAGEMPEIDGLMADVAGLKQDLDAARAELETVKSQLTEKATDAEAARRERDEANAKVEKAMEAEKAAKAEATSTKEQLEAAVAEARAPFTAKSGEVEKSGKPDVKNMKFDDAFDALLHS